MKTIVDWAQIIGAFAALLAIRYAVRAQRDATNVRKSVSIERRRLFELQILREIVDLVDQGLLHEIQFHPGRLAMFKHRFALLTSGTLPYWQELSDLNWYMEVRAGTKYESRQEAANQAYTAHLAVMPTAEADLATWEEERLLLAAELAESARAFEVYVREKLLDQLMLAIKNRVDALDD